MVDRDDTRGRDMNQSQTAPASSRFGNDLDDLARRLAALPYRIVVDANGNRRRVPPAGFAHQG